MKHYCFVLLCLFCFYTFPANAVSEIETTQGIDWARTYGSIKLHKKTSLKKALSKMGPLHSWISLKLGSLYISQKKYHEAINTLKKIPEEGPWTFWKNSLISEAYLGLNSPHHALKLLNNLPEEPDASLTPNQNFYRLLYKQTLETKIKALKSSNKKTKQISSRIWGLFPDLEEKKTSSAPAGTTSKDRAIRLHALYAKKMYDEISKFTNADDISRWRIPSSEKCKSFLELGISQRKIKKSKKGLTAFTMAVKEKCEEKDYVRSLYWKGRMEKNQKKHTAAIKTYRTLARKSPHNRYTDDAYYALWNIYKKLRQKENAKWAYSKLINLPSGDMKASVIWKSAYENYKKRRYKSAIRDFEKILAHKPGGDESYPQALYWKARSMERMKGSNEKGISNDPKIFYKQLKDQFPYSFYSTLASVRLNKPPKSPNIPKLREETPIDPEIWEVTATVNLLNEMGFSKEAQNVLDYFSQQNRSVIETLTPLMALKWMESGDYNQALTIASNHLGISVIGVFSGGTDSVIRAFYPLAFSKEAKEGYRRTNLPRGIIEAIMREESLFQPTVRSHAGAIGVMQLMPATARKQASKINLAGFKIRNLDDPKTNILLGSTFLSRMVSLYDQNIPLAVMAYNAGPGNVRKWLRRKGKLPLDEFIEEIPFTETRNYVKRVLRSAQVYSFLLKSPSSKKPMFTMKVR